MSIKIQFILMSILLTIGACTKEKTEVVTDNQAPTVNNVPAIKIENYVNRVFIDLLGREPLDSEMAAEVATLRTADLTTTVREDLIIKLQTATDFIEGDTTYKRAYSQHVYNLAKARCLEGASDVEVGNFIDLGSEADNERLQEVLNARLDFQNDSLPIHQLFGRMIYNLVYDEINMNSFNFVNATFDNLYLRFPTNAEFQAGFNMVENQTTELFLGTMGSDKRDYVEIIIHTPEMFEGLINWTYQQLLARRPTTEETAALLANFLEHQDIRLIQRAIMVTDEYGDF